MLVMVAAAAAAAGAAVNIARPIWFSQFPACMSIVLAAVGLAAAVAAVGAGTASLQGKVDGGEKDTHHDALVAIYLGWLSVPLTVCVLLFPHAAQK